jgi:hypothetical protein
MAKLGEITAQYSRLRAEFSARDSARIAVLNVRTGRIANVFPDLFPPDGPLADKSLAANMVDIAARDVSEVLAPLPTVLCNSGTSASDRARDFADKRTKVANNYLAHASVQMQMYTAADRYTTYGTSVALVEPDWDNQMPFINFLDPIGIYVVRDRFFRITKMFQTVIQYVDTLLASYPELASQIKSRAGSGQQLEIVRYHDKDEDILFMPQSGGYILHRQSNPLGEVMVRDANRPGVTDEPRGQFDDVLAIQVAKHRFALLAMKASITAVDAPIAVPQDVQELAIGSEAILRSASPERIRRIGLDVPREAFIEQQQLDSELRNGSRYPEARTGAVDGSIVTGKGVQALMGGFDTQIRTGQAMFARMLQELVSLCFRMDEALWPDVTKTIRGNQNGTPFEVNYKPSRDIAGDHSVDVQYGLMAGLDPNRALVFGLQARGDKLISRDFLRSQMPFSLDPSEEEQKVDIEELRDALKQAVAGYAQAIPALASQGQDPGDILRRLSDVIVGRQKGRAIEDLISEAFAPPEPPPGVEQSAAGASPDMGAPAAPPGAGSPDGMSPDGLMRGVAPGQQALGPGGRPDVQNLLAGLTSRGDAALSANVQRRQPI